MDIIKKTRIALDFFNSAKGDPSVIIRGIGVPLYVTELLSSCSGEELDTVRFSMIIRSLEEISELREYSEPNDLDLLEWAASSKKRSEYYALRGYEDLGIYANDIDVLRRAWSIEKLEVFSALMESLKKEHVEKNRRVWQLE